MRACICWHSILHYSPYSYISYANPNLPKGEALPISHGYKDQFIANNKNELSQEVEVIEPWGDGGGEGETSCRCILRSQFADSIQPWKRLYKKSLLCLSQQHAPVKMRGSPGLQMFCLWKGVAKRPWPITPSSQTLQCSVFAIYSILPHH